MKKTIMEIYALAVCFVTVVCFVIALGMALYGIIGIVNPEFTMNSYTYTQHQTNDSFWNGGPTYAPPPPLLPGEVEKKRNRPSEADLTKQREASYMLAISNERRDNTQTGVKTLIIILIDLMVFLFHWFVARRARENAA